MRRRSLYAAALFLVAAATQAGGQTTDRTRIAVLDLKSETVGSAQLRLISDRLRNRLFETGRFAVMERDRMRAILEEAGFRQTDLCDEACVAEMGHLLGAQAMVFGSLGKIGGTYMLQLRLVSVESGAIVATSTHDCVCRLEEVAVQLVDAATIELAAHSYLGWLARICLLRVAT